MIFITWVYQFLYPKPDEAKTYQEELLNNLTSLFKQYEETYKKNDTPRSQNNEVATTSCSGLGKRSFEMFLETVEGLNSSKTDLEYYLEEVPLKVPGGTKFDVLTWWMGNEPKYPILSKLAKDVLSIPVTTVASEATFSAGKRVIDPKRSSMKTKTVEMLLCGGDWIKEKYGIKKGQSQSVLEVPQDDPLQYHFGEQPTAASTT